MQASALSNDYMNTKQSEEIEYQLMMINRILTVWYAIENTQPIFE